VHILLIHQVFNTPQQGGGTRHFELCRRLVAHGNEVTVVTSDVEYKADRVRREKPTIVGGIHVLYAWAPRGVHRNFLRRLWAFLAYSVSSFWVAIRVPHVDVVWGTSPPLPQAETARLVAAIDKVPFVFEVRDLWVDNAVELNIVRNHTLVSAAHGLESRLYRAASRVVVNSPGFVTEVSKRTSPSKVIVVPNGVECSDFLPGQEPGRYRELFGLNADSIVVLYAGNMGMANDLETVVGSADILRSRTDVEFHFFGSGMHVGSLKELVLLQHLRNVYFHEPVPKAAMPQLLCCADVCVAPLRDTPLFSLVFPNKVFDYMAAGKPIIYTIGGPIREALTSARTGAYVKPGDSQSMATALLRYADDPDLRIADGRRAAAYAVEHFDRHVAAERLASLMADVVAHRR
jgi:glycosyltransferase involved in cell wall biosynthesis